MNCTATTKRGTPCAAPALAGSDFCFTHDPARAQDRAAARKRGGYNRRTPKATPDDGARIHLRTVAHVQATLERALADTWAQENSANRTGGIVRIALAALRALEVGELEQRVEALEARITEQQAPGLRGVA